MLSSKLSIELLLPVLVNELFVSYISSRFVQNLSSLFLNVLTSFALINEAAW